MATKTTKKPRRTIAERAADAVAPILAALESGDAMVWRKPWHPGECQVGSTDNTYKGVNQVQTAMIAAERGYESRRWWTFDHILRAGGGDYKIIKFPNGGKKRVPVWGDYSVAGTAGRWITVVGVEIKFVTEENEETGEEQSRFAGLRLHTHNVLNLDEVTGMPDHIKYPEHLSGNVNPNTDPIAAAEAIRAAWADAPRVIRKGDRACYFRKSDMIHLPPDERFHSMEERYSTGFHEDVHATGHPSRLNRPGVANATKFGDNDYGFEEIVAEIGAAGLCGLAGISAQTVDNSAAYCQHWLKEINGDPVAFIRAAEQAFRAVQYIMGETPDQQADKAAAALAAA